MIVMFCLKLLVMYLSKNVSISIRNSHVRIVIFDTFALLLVSIVVSIYASVLYSYVRQTDRIHTHKHTASGVRVEGKGEEEGQ